MKIHVRFAQHIEAKKAELDVLLDRAIEASATGWRDDFIANAIELQKEITAAEALLTLCLKKGATQ